MPLPNMYGSGSFPAPPMMLTIRPHRRARMPSTTRRRADAQSHGNELLDLWGETRNTVLFITHDLEEAIALSDEVLVLTAGPRRVKASYPIPLPRPRNVIEIRFRDEFTRLYEQIWKDLRDEVQQSYARSTQI
jgi:ABC-type taurine transport system ATPase subunit